MKSGIIRRVDDLGRIVLPKEIRRTMKITDGTPMEIYTNGEQIILTKYIPEADLLGILSIFEEHLNDMCVDFGSKKTGDIRRHIRDIHLTLSEQN